MMIVVCQVAEELVTLAYDNGVNVFDTAEVYSGGKYVRFAVDRYNIIITSAAYFALNTPE